MIEYKIDFDGDFPLWQRICHKFWVENGYYVIEEVPGWLRAVDPSLYDIRLHKLESKHWATLYFKHESDKTAFLLRWV